MSEIYYIAYEPCDGIIHVDDHLECYTIEEARKIAREEFENHKMPIHILGIVETIK